LTIAATILWPFLRLPRHAMRVACVGLDVAWKRLNSTPKDSSPHCCSRMMAVDAGRQLGDVAWLIVDQRPAMDQVADFVMESGEALEAVAGVHITGAERIWALMLIAEGFLGRINQKHSDERGAQ
jgi:hypothetical protein